MAKPLLLDAATINEIVAEGSQWAESEKLRLIKNYANRDRSVSFDSPQLCAELLRNCIAWVKSNFLEKCLASCDVSADRQLRLLRIADDPASDVFDPYCQETQRAVIRAGTDAIRRLEQLAERGLPSRSPVATSLKAMADLAAAQWSMQVAKVFDGPNGKRSEFALLAREVRADRLRPLSRIPTSGPQPDDSAFVAAKKLRKQRGVTATVKKRRRRPPLQLKQLTAKQLEASKLHGECEGNFAEVARRMGIDRKTAVQHIEAAFTKLGKSVPTKAKTIAFRTDRRGQADIAKSDDHRE